MKKILILVCFLLIALMVKSESESNESFEYDISNLEVII